MSAIEIELLKHKNVFLFQLTVSIALSTNIIQSASMIPVVCVSMILIIFVYVMSLVGPNVFVTIGNFIRVIIVCLTVIVSRAVLQIEQIFSASVRDVILAQSVSITRQCFHSASSLSYRMTSSLHTFLLGLQPLSLTC